MSKEIKRLLGVEILAFIVVMALVIGLKASADVVVPVPETDVPFWLKSVMDFLVSIPYVGPVLVEILKWIGVVAAVTTGLSTLIMGVAKALKELGKALGFVTFAEKVDAAYQKVWPYIAWLSVYNVPKKV